MSYTLNLSSSDLVEVNNAMKREKESKVFKRLVALKLTLTGLSHKEIASTLNVHIDTITDWLKIYINHGLDALCELHLEHRKKSKLDEHKEEIQNLIKVETISTIAQLQNYIKQLYGIQIEHSWLCRYCKKNSIALIKRQG